MIIIFEKTCKYVNMIKKDCIKLSRDLKYSCVIVAQ